MVNTYLLPFQPLFSSWFFCLFRYVISFYACILFFLVLVNFFSFFFVGPHPWHMEVSRLGVELELQLPSFAPATATGDPSHVCSLHHSSKQCHILNPLSQVRDLIHILMDPSWIHYHWATMENVQVFFFFFWFWFAVALFFKCVNAFLYLLALAW